MVRNKGKRKLIAALSILFVLLVAIGTIAIVRALNSNNPDPYLQDTSSTSDSDANTDEGTAGGNQSQTDPSDENKSDNQGGDEATDIGTPAPETVSTIDIPPMDITVSYVKGVGGFEYEVLRANNGTRYVEFRNESLVGTKCTNDQGTFASIIANPTASESVTLAKTQQVGDATYGLSLAEETCTSDTTLLQRYQKSFSDAFPLLKKMD